MTALIDMAAQQLRDTWQAKVLATATHELGAVATAIIAHEWPVAMPFLLRVVFGKSDLEPPFLIGYATINKAGIVCCEMKRRDGMRCIAGIYRSEIAMRDDFRKLADRLKLSDADRVALFGVLKKWVTCDLRIDHHGDKRLH